MPPKAVFSREDIIQAALDIVETEGLHALTTRNVASQLRSSNAPLYKYFNSICELKSEVGKRAKQTLGEFTTKEYSDCGVLNILMGIVLFARDKRELFRILFLENDEYQEIAIECIQAIRELLKDNDTFLNACDDDMELLIFKIWAFTYGFARQAYFGRMVNNSDHYIKSTLFDCCSALVDAMFKSRPETI